MRKKGQVILGIILVLWMLQGKVIYATENLEEQEISLGVVTANTLNIRQGPDETQTIIETVSKDTEISLLSKLGEWYVIQTSSGKVGCASMQYIQEKEQNKGGETENGLTQMTEMETMLLNTINQKRKENNLVELTIDDELQNVARLKAIEMVEKDYFSHTSPTYGSPFEMMDQMGITYKVAGENIAGNISPEEAINAWMQSEGHRDNILENGYNYTGIGIAKSPKYGNIFVQMFIGR